MKKMAFSKSLLLLVFFQLSSIASLFAQDTIYTKDARELSVKVESSDGNVVKFRPFGDNSAQLRTIEVQFIDFIKYENGSIEHFVNTNIPENSEDLSGEASLDYLNVQYEKYLARYTIHKKLTPVAGLSFYTWFVGFAIIGEIADVLLEPGYLAIWLIPSSIFLTTRIITGSISKNSLERLNYFDSRIKEISFIITPNNQILYAESGRISDKLSVGLRFTF